MQSVERGRELDLRMFCSYLAKRRGGVSMTIGTWQWAARLTSPIGISPSPAVL